MSCFGGISVLSGMAGGASHPVKGVVLGTPCVVWGRGSSYTSGKKYKWH